MLATGVPLWQVKPTLTEVASVCRLSPTTRSGPRSSRATEKPGAGLYPVIVAVSPTQAAVTVPPTVLTVRETWLGAGSGFGAGSGGPALGAGGPPPVLPPAGAATRRPPAPEAGPPTARAPGAARAAAGRSAGSLARHSWTIAPTSSGTPASGGNGAGSW